MTPLQARTDYRPGWYLIEMKVGTPLVRFFRDGQSWLCDPQEFFAPRIAYEEHQGLSATADLQVHFPETMLEMICKGPVTQFDPTSWDAVAALPQLIQETEV